MKYLWSLIFLSIAYSGPLAPTANAAKLAKLDQEERDRLLASMQCPASTWNRLYQMKAGMDIDGPLSVTTTACRLALDAFCTSSPDHASCRDREPTGAYAGYYLMRYVMPMVVMSRRALRHPNPTPNDENLTRVALESLFRTLHLLSPDLRGCANLPYLRTWCTVANNSYLAVSSHRAAVAYLGSESLRLLSECRDRGEACPLSTDRTDPALARWFDVLLWDHVLFDGTFLRNSLTQDVGSHQPTMPRLRYLHDSFDVSGSNRVPFQFATDGWWIATAANLLAVDALLAGEGDPRAVALTEPQQIALHALVDVGVSVLRQRAEPTRLRDFDGSDVAGLEFDSKLWDRHEYRRFSAVSEGPRPFSVVPQSSESEPTVVYAGADERRAQNVGLDSGHYRRLTWLYYTLSDVQDALDTNWIDSDVLEGLANQFAYGVHWHDCHHRRTEGCSSNNDPRDSDAVPRFVNYVSGQSGWYRLTPTQPCDAGVPPFGFSTLMVLSENLWWARFNDDVATIWARLDAALNEPDLPPPSQGDTVPCGEHMGTMRWNESYHQTAFEPDGRLTRHGLGFYAMKYWAELALQNP